MRGMLVTLISGALLAGIGAFIDVQLLKADVKHQNFINEKIYESIKEIRSDVKVLLQRDSKK